MKWILSLLLLISLTGWSQDRIFGDWYHISTGRLVQMGISKDIIWWNDRTFQFQDKEGKFEEVDLITVYRKNDMAGIVHRSKDTADRLPYGLTVLEQPKDFRFVDVLLNCSDASYGDTVNIHNNFEVCSSSEKLRMRFYNKATIDSFKTLKPVQSITKNDLNKMNKSLKKEIERLINDFGEDKLLWIAPLIFQQVLTDLLLGNGYNPMLTEEQSEKLFDFNF